MCFDPDFPNQDSIKSIVRRHGQILFRPFHLEDLRVEILHLEVDPVLSSGYSLAAIERRSTYPGHLMYGHASPLVIVHKKEGEIRIKVYYREANQHLRASANQLPYQDMLLQQLGGQKYYAKMDNLWGYHELRLDKESSKVTVNITPWVSTDFWHAPGISTAPGEYQARMAHKVLEEF